MSDENEKGTETPDARAVAFMEEFWRRVAAKQQSPGAPPLLSDDEAIQLVTGFQEQRKLLDARVGDQPAAHMIDTARFRLVTGLEALFATIEEIRRVNRWLVSQLESSGVLAQPGQKRLADQVAILREWATGMYPGSLTPGDFALPIEAHEDHKTETSDGE